MKRVVLFFLAAVLAITLVGCGDPKPDDKFSADAVAALEAAIETLDEFLAYDMSAEDAAERLEKIGNSLGDEDFYDNNTRLRISAVETMIVTYGIRENLGSNAGGLSKIREQRDDLYDYLYGK